MRNYKFVLCVLMSYFICFSCDKDEPIEDVDKNEEPDGNHEYDDYFNILFSTETNQDFVLNQDSNIALIRQKNTYAVLPKASNPIISSGYYEFVGWCTKKDGSENVYKEGDSVLVNSNMVLYSIWRKKGDYVVIFDVPNYLWNLGETMEPQYLEKDFTEYVIPNNTQLLKKRGARSASGFYGLVGWSLNPNAEVPDYLVEEIVKNDAHFSFSDSTKKVLYPIFGLMSKLTDKKYNILFDVTIYDYTSDAPEAIGFDDLQNECFSFPSLRQICLSDYYPLTFLPFKEWNTKKDGTGISFRADEICVYGDETYSVLSSYFSVNKTLILYAIYENI
ncbi:MAG: InlB B-repeat-containing protein [Paludibacteraceae bacterium]|nr:InlB B-repeat-containing protein [Paludibacteraceae bacterium]